MPVYLNRCFTTCLQADSTVAPPMASLHFHVRFGMERRARPPPIRLHLLPVVRTGCLLLPPSPCCNKSSPGSSLGSSPFNSRRRGAALPTISTEVGCGCPSPPRPHLVKHLLGPAHKFCLRLFPFQCAPPWLFSSHSPSLPPFIHTKIWDAPHDRRNNPDLCA